MVFDVATRETRLGYTYGNWSLCIAYLRMRFVRTLTNFDCRADFVDTYDNVLPYCIHIDMPDDTILHDCMKIASSCLIYEQEYHGDKFTGVCIQK